MVGLWVVAGFFFVSGWLLMLNYKQAAERTFNFLIEIVPFKGTATPKTLRLMGAGWIFVSVAVTVPDLFILSN